MRVKVNSIEELKKELHENGIDIAEYGKGKAKSLEHLYDEIRKGESILLVKKGKLMRCIKVVDVRVFYEDKDNLYGLFESAQRFSDGRTRRRKNDFIAEKLMPEENPVSAVKRAIKEELGIKSKIKATKIKKYYEKKESPSYPCLDSLYEIYRFHVHLDKSHYSSKGYVERKKDKSTYFVWKKIKG